MGWGSNRDQYQYIQNNTAPNRASPMSNLWRPEPPKEQNWQEMLIRQLMGKQEEEEKQQRGRQEQQQQWSPEQGGPSVGHNFSGGGQDFAGMRGGPHREGPQTAEYYPMGMIPTASNAEHTSQFSNKYNYSGTPSLGDMVRAPWRPETWDPNIDFIGQNNVRGHRLGRGSRRRERRMR
jgi:hypothetical protein